MLGTERLRTKYPKCTLTSNRDLLGLASTCTLFNRRCLHIYLSRHNLSLDSLLSGKRASLPREAPIALALHCTPEPLPFEELSCDNLDVYESPWPLVCLDSIIRRCPNLRLLSFSFEVDVFFALSVTTQRSVVPQLEAHLGIQIVATGRA